MAIKTMRGDSAVRESRVPVRGASLYLREVGEGAAFVVVHGGPDFNHAYFLPELDSLSSAFRLVYYDQRGRGKSSRGVVPADVTIESEVEDLDAVRRHLGLEAIALIGHSWGSLLAMEYAARHADRLSQLILMNSAPASHAGASRFREQRRAREADTLAAMRAIAATPRYASGDIETEAEYYRAHFARALARPDRVDEIVARLRADFSPEDIVKARAIEERLYDETWRRPDYDLAKRLVNVTAPALVIHGDRDLIPLECAASVAGAIPGARLNVLRECGHFAYLEQPEAVRQAIVELMDSRRA